MGRDLTKDTEPLSSGLDEDRLHSLHSAGRELLRELWGQATALLLPCSGKVTLPL